MMRTRHKRTIKWMVVLAGLCLGLSLLLLQMMAPDPSFDDAQFDLERELQALPKNQRDAVQEKLSLLLLQMMAPDPSFDGAQFNPERKLQALPKDQRDAAREKWNAFSETEKNQAKRIVQSLSESEKQKLIEKLKSQSAPPAHRAEHQTAKKRPKSQRGTHPLWKPQSRFIPVHRRGILEVLVNKAPGE